jgi:hypothetical protein
LLAKEKIPSSVRLNNNKPLVLKVKKSLNPNFFKSQNSNPRDPKTSSRK